VVGDASTYADAARYQAATDEINSKYDDVEPVVVAKSLNTLNAIEQDTVVGYPNGYADITADDFSDPRDWRSRRVHVLGGSPVSQKHVIDQLTQPTLGDRPPADIVGLDTNCFLKIAYKGEYWTPDGWQPADHLSIRKTVARSLQEAKQFWQDHGVWPQTPPIDEYGPAVTEPDTPVFLDNGGNPIQSREELESAVIGEYGGRTLAFQTEAGKRFTEYRADLI
jgi:hypothetical protein